MASAEDSSDVVMEVAIEKIEESLPETTATPAATSKVTDETPLEAVLTPEVANEMPADEMPAVEVVLISEIAVETSVEAVSKPQVFNETPVEAVSKPDVAEENAPAVEEEDEDETGSPGSIFCFDNDFYISYRPFLRILDAIFTKQLKKLMPILRFVSKLNDHHFCISVQYTPSKGESG